MPLDTALTSELGAINIILESADEAPVSSLALTGLYPLEKAKACLSEASRSIQSIGWQFNTEEDYEVPLNGSSEAVLPGNTLEFDPEDTLDSAFLVQRGLRLYDRKKHTYALSAAPKGRVVFLLGWDELPEVARRLILVRAARLMQGRSTVSDSTRKYTEEDEALARAAMEASESRVGDHNFLRDSQETASFFYNFTEW